MRNIIVCLKVVPKTEEIVFDPETKTIDRSKASNEINEADKNALELALQIKDRYGGKVIIVSMGPPLFEEFLKLGVAMGADDAVLISDRALAGSDAFVTSKVLAKAIEKIGDYDLILCGEESSDGSTGQVPPGIAQWLNLPVVTYVSELKEIKDDSAVVKRVLFEGHEIIKVKLPSVLSVELGCNTPRFPDFRRKKKIEEEFKVTYWNINDLGLKPEEVGLVGSKTTVDELQQLELKEREKRIIEDVDEAVKVILDAFKS